MQRKKKGRRGGPLAEVDYWRERATAVCALYDQFNAPAVAPVLELFARIDTSMDLLRRDIGKLYEEANDITRSELYNMLLSTQRHPSPNSHDAPRPPHLLFPSLPLPPFPSFPFPYSSSRRNEYQPKGGDALRLGSKGRFIVRVWVAGKSV